MFPVRPGFARMAAVAVAGATCLAAVACGGTSASSLSTAPSASSAPDPLASLTALKVAQETAADDVAASSVTIAGTASQSGQNDTIDVAIKRGQGCKGTIGLGAEGSVKLIMIGKTVYMDPDNQFWTSNSGSSASAVIALVNGRYIETSAGEKTVVDLGNLCVVSQLLKVDPTTGETIAKGPVTTLDGTRVLELKDSNGTLDYVTDTSKPELVESTAPKGTAGGSGKLTFTTGTPVTLTAPPASQVIEGSKLGI
jgi:hypothetical protein